MAASGGGDNNGSSLEYTPTWAVAAVCPFIVIISFVLERAIYFLAKELKKKNKKLLLETLERVKEGPTNLLAVICTSIQRVKALLFKNTVFKSQNLYSSVYHMSPVITNLKRENKRRGAANRTEVAQETDF